MKLLKILPTNETTFMLVRVFWISEKNINQLWQTSCGNIIQYNHNSRSNSDDKLCDTIPIMIFFKQIHEKCLPFAFEAVKSLRIFEVLWYSFLLVFANLWYSSPVVIFVWTPKSTSHFRTQLWYELLCIKTVQWHKIGLKMDSCLTELRSE